jgi:FAD/FMN-containing dehydrogenase
MSTIDRDAHPTVDQRLFALVGKAAVRTDAETLAAHGSDMTENESVRPNAVISIETVEQLRGVVALAAELRVALTPRVAGTNLGGLAIPARDGWVLDLTPMNRIVELSTSDMVAVIEPGVTFGQLDEAMQTLRPKLTIGFPLSPPESSVAVNCLLDGLGNLSLRHGSMADWIAGLEVVRADGSLLRTGASALGVPVPFSRAPLPDLTGLFVSWQSTTGIVSKLAVHLWPEPAFRERSFVLAYDRSATFRALRDLPRLDLLNDLGGVSWPCAKMLLGVQHPRERDPAEPEFFFYLDMGAATETLLREKRRALERYLADLRREGLRLEDPLSVADLVRLEPRLDRLARFPTRLDFFLDHPDGGLTWVGTYGPMSRFERAYDRGAAIVERHGFPPTVVARPMKGGHFAVLRFIQVFKRGDPADIDRVRRCNTELCDALIEEGYIMYKTPAWAVERYRTRLDPGYGRLMGEIKALLDPNHILNAGRWPLH